MNTAEILTQSVDKTQLPPLHQKRVLAFVNHFLISSCGFLNDFAVQCERKFLELERKLQKVEAALTIIEAKLDSIPEVKETNTLIFNDQENSSEQLADDVAIKQSDGSIHGIKASEHDLYKKFFKMLQVGVPIQAVKIKMQVEGLNSNLLDNPNVIIPFANSQNT